MAVPTSIDDLDPIAANNGPAGSEKVFPNLDDYLRAVQSFIAINRDKLADLGLDVTALDTDKADKATTLDGYGITDGALKATKITAGVGLTGGGAIDQDRGIGLGTPGGLTASTGNSSIGTTHYHSVDFASAFNPRSISGNGHILLPSGLVIQWGNANVNGSLTVTFPRSFATCYSVIGIACGRTGGDGNISVITGETSGTSTAFHVRGQNSQAISSAIYWIAIGSN